MGSNYAGVDWASERHDVLIAEETGEELLEAGGAYAGLVSRDVPADELGVEEATSG